MSLIGAAEACDSRAGSGGARGRGRGRDRGCGSCSCSTGWHTNAASVLYQLSDGSAKTREDRERD